MTWSSRNGTGLWCELRNVRNHVSEMSELETESECDYEVEGNGMIWIGLLTT